jgi:hypothetical protein
MEKKGGGEGLFSFSSHPYPFHTCVTSQKPTSRLNREGGSKPKRISVIPSAVKSIQPRNTSIVLQLHFGLYILLFSLLLFFLSAEFEPNSFCGNRFYCGSHSPCFSFGICLNSSFPKQRKSVRFVPSDFKYSQRSIAIFT